MPEDVVGDLVRTYLLRLFHVKHEGAFLGMNEDQIDFHVSIESFEALAVDVGEDGHSYVAEIRQSQGALEYLKSEGVKNICFVFIYVSPVGQWLLSTITPEMEDYD